MGKPGAGEFRLRRPGVNDGASALVVTSFRRARELGVEPMARIVAQVRAAWPEVRIILRGDSGFCRDQLMSWCEDNGVDFVFGMARNQRLRKIIGAQLHEATEQWQQTATSAQALDCTPSRLCGPPSSPHSSAIRGFLSSTRQLFSPSGKESLVHRTLP